ncbi:dihydrofolate reductase family protein [Nocardioides sp.]|uniref:dihydrofolate reductase family protein n=1 Tax=Nocardioides sp. TaxID=35761 RepID=UPI002D809BAA|nr:dihydrofolate reductase family protein [Nocardioides sp.]HET8961608.1 dihydrofolate reductase family protein [Nocardioides sp.]
MTRTQYYTATSADGFIADEHNSLDWLFEVGRGAEVDPADSREEEWDEFIGGVGSMAMGATTYEWVLDHENLLENPQRWHDYYGDRPAFVFTHRDLPPIPGVDLRFVSGQVSGVYDDLVAAAAGRNIWVVGGGDLVGQFDDAGLLDEILLNVTPVFLGAGAPLLPRRITSERVTVREARQAGQRVRIVLDVRRPGQAGASSAK